MTTQLLWASPLTRLFLPESTLNARDVVLIEALRQPVEAAFQELMLEPLKQLELEWTIDTLEASGGRGTALSGPINSHLTALVVLACERSKLVFMDPRAHAARFYPSVIGQGHFGAKVFQPRPGEVWLFPSYLQYHLNSERDGHYRYRRFHYTAEAINECTDD